ncbi:MAG: DUF202 domain-containing protein [Acidimicrobiales bacterium]
MNDLPMDPVGADLNNDGGLQFERTTLAWERTAIAMMVAGIVLARTAAASGHYLLGSAGVAQTAAGGALLVWAGFNSYELHSMATPASGVPQVTLTRLIGLVTVMFTAVATALTLLGTVAS